MFDKDSKFGTLVEVTQPLEVSSEKTIIQCGKTVIIVSLKREPIIAQPKQVEIMETVDYPGTPSTVNDGETEQKQSTMESKNKQKSRGRPKKDRQLYRIEAEPLNEDGFDSMLVESKILSQSKKIFKIIKPEVSMTEDNEKKKGRKRN